MGANDQESHRHSQEPAAVATLLRAGGAPLGEPAALSFDKTNLIHLRLASVQVVHKPHYVSTGVRGLYYTLDWRPQHY